MQQVLCSEQQPCSHLRVLHGGCSVLSCCAEGLEKGSWHLCSATCCQRQLIALSFSTMVSSSDICCHESKPPRVLGGLGNRVGASWAAGRSSGGSAGESPEISVAGDAGNYVPGRILPVDPPMFPSLLQCPEKQLTSLSLMSVSWLTWLSLFMFYPA